MALYERNYSHNTPGKKVLEKIRIDARRGQGQSSELNPQPQHFSSLATAILSPHPVLPSLSFLTAIHYNTKEECDRGLKQSNFCSITSRSGGKQFFFTFFLYIYYVFLYIFSSFLNSEAFLSSTLFSSPFIFSLFPVFLI